VPIEVIVEDGEGVGLLFSAVIWVLLLVSVTLKPVSVTRKATSAICPWFHRCG
jgi:hypothetical protein